ncbi:hypothetical protein HanLR1_Chr00c0301g0737081 [Helianthus annuus]|nr:hypothetical protein HanHA89_Chr17g0703281 [Helianthus annuus]KAJ0818893.1 hypothetical protein HanLR1_Chr00c0301g0737081 [Helianthus annuus]
MVMWFRMATVSMQPWQIYLLYLILYKSEPHNHFITLTTVLVYICYVFGFGTFNNASTERTKAVRLSVGFDLLGRSQAGFAQNSVCAPLQSAITLYNAGHYRPIANIHVPMYPSRHDVNKLQDFS